MKIKIKLRILLILFLFNFLNCEKTKFIDETNRIYEYETINITQDIYLLKTIVDKTRWVNANIVVIINADDVFVVDSGLLPSAGYLAIEKIKELTDKPVRYLVNTHWHGDHWQGNEAFVKTYPDIQIISSTVGFNDISTDGVKDATEGFINMFSSGIERREKEYDLKQTADGKDLSKEALDDIADRLKYYKLTVAELREMKIVLPNLLFDKKLVIKTPQREIQILHFGNANTPGDAIVYLPNDKVLISGDVVVYPTPYESGGFSDSWKSVFDQMATLDFDYLIPGHGEVLKDDTYIRFLSKIFETISLKTNKMYEDGLSQDEAFEKLTIDVVKENLDGMKAELKVHFEKFDPSFIKAAIATKYREINKSN